MAKSKTEMEVNIGANIKELVKAIEEAKKLISSLSDSFKQGLKLAVDVKNIKSEIRDVKNEIKSELIAKPFKVNVEVDSNKLKYNIKTALREAIKEINTQGINSKLKLPTAPKMRVTVDTSSARTSIRNLKNMLQKNEVRINTGKAEGDIIRLSTYMNQLASKKVTPQIDTSKAEQAKLSIAELATYMNQLQSKKIKIDISFSNKDIVNNLKDIDSLLKSIQKNSNIKLNVNATGRASGGGGVQSQLQQYRTLRQEARHFALEAEKAWIAGNKQGFEQNRQNFLVAMKDLADFSRQLGNLSASKEAGMYSNMLRSLQQTSPLYNDILNKIKQLKQEQKDFNNLINEGNKKLQLGGGGLRQSGSQQRLPGFAQGTVGASAYAVHYLGRSSKGFGSFGEATAQLISDLDSMGGAMHRVMLLAASLAGTVAVTVTVFTAAIKGIEVFGGLLKQIGQEVYNALKPGIDLYKQQTSAFFSFTASLMSNSVVGGQKLSEMPSGMATAMGLSNKLLQQAQVDAEMSAFSLRDILASLQGTLPILMSKGMTMEQAYEINKGVAAVAKMIQLTPSQILQETRDLAQGSITSRGSQVANALGVTNADLKKFEGDAEGLFKFLTEKFKQYSELLQQFEDTAIGRFQQLEERWQTVARSMIDGMLPQFKGAFEELINATGQWVAKSGTYINEFGERVKYGGIASLDALTGKWRDAQGNILENFQADNKWFELAKPFKEVQEILPEIIQYLADMVDRLLDFIQKETGINDPIQLAKKIIEGIADGFELCVRILVSLITEVGNYQGVILEAINLMRGFVNILGIVLTFAQLIGGALSYGISKAGILYDKLFGNESQNKLKLREDIADLKWDKTKYESGRFLSEVGSQKPIRSMDELFESLKYDSDGKLGFFGKASRKKSGGEIIEELYGLKGARPSTTVGMKDAKGEPKNTEDDKARKKQIQESQKAMKARIAELKNTLKDALDELKNILNKNKISYEEGFTTLKEYLQLEAQSSVDEAQMKLAEAQTEREQIVNALYNNEDDRKKALAEVDKNISVYTRELNNSIQASKEVGNAITKGATTIADAIDNFNISQAFSKSNVNGAVAGSAVNNNVLAQVAEDLGASAEDLALVIQEAQKYNIDPKIALALVEQESGFNQNAISPAGAIGFTQLMTDTASGLGVNPYDKLENIDGGMKYLSQQLERFGGSFEKALAAYNAGPAAVEKYGGVPPYAETQNYVASILGNHRYDNIISAIASNMTDGIGNLLISAAAEEVNKGTPYVWGGATLGQGVDCSGLIYAIWNKLYGEAVSQLGDEFPRTADYQAVAINKAGAFFDDANMLQVGDLVFFRGADPGEMGVGHVGMYAGNNKFIEARKSGTNVMYSDLASRSDVVGFGDVRKYFESLGLSVDRSGGSNTSYKSGAANTTDKGHTAWKYIQEQQKEMESILANIDNSFIGHYKMETYKLTRDYERNREKVIKDNLLSQKDLDTYLDALDKSYYKSLLDAKSKSIESLANFNASTMDRNAEFRAYEIAIGKRDFDEYIGHVSSMINTVDDKNNQWLGNQIIQLENLAKDYEYKGYIVEAVQIREKISQLRNKPYEIANKAIEEVNAQFDIISNQFAEMSMTNLQRTRGEEDIKRYKAQANARMYSNLLSKYASDYNRNSSDIAIAKDEQKLLNKESERYKKLQADIDMKSRDNAIIQKLADTANAYKNLNEEILRSSEALNKLHTTAKQALEDGLVEFLSESIFEADSLEDALLGLAKTFLKEMQQFLVNEVVTDLMQRWFPVKTKEGEHTSLENLASHVDLTKLDDGSIVTANAVNESGVNIVNAINSQTNALLSNGGVYNKPFSSDWGQSSLNTNRKEYDVSSGLNLGIDSFGFTGLEHSVFDLTNKFTVLSQEAELMKNNVEMIASTDGMKQQASAQLNLTESTNSLGISSDNAKNNIDTLAQSASQASSVLSQIGMNGQQGINQQQFGSYSILDSLLNAQNVVGSGASYGMTNNGQVSREKNSYQSLTHTWTEMSFGGIILQSLMDTMRYGWQAPFRTLITGLADKQASEESKNKALTKEPDTAGSSGGSPKLYDDQAELVSLAGQLQEAIGVAIGAMDELKQAISNLVTEINNKLNELTTGMSGMSFTIDSFSKTSGSTHVYSSGVGYSASGGYITGKGTSTSDSIPTMLSNGEYVIKASAVDKYGLPFLNAINNGKDIRRFADGGSTEDNIAKFSSNTTSEDSITSILISIENILNSIQGTLSEILTTNKNDVNQKTISTDENQVDNSYTSYAKSHEFSKSIGGKIYGWGRKLGLGTDMEDNRLVDQLDEETPKHFKMMVDLLQVIADNSFELVNLGHIGMVFDLANLIFLPLIYNELMHLRFAKMFGFSSGGKISGSGTSVSDSIPAMLSDGEYVIRADSVRKYGTNFLDAINTGKFSKIKSQVPRYAQGGEIGTVASQETAKGTQTFANQLSTSMSMTNHYNIALVRDENEAMEQFMRSSRGQNIMLDFNRRTASYTNRITR